MAPISYQKYIGSEESFQISLARYLDHRGVLWFHCPNEIKAKPQYLAKRKSLGVKAGVPDVCILEPRKSFHGLFIELKVGYNKPTEPQMNWIDKLSEMGYSAHFTNSFDEAVYIIDNYLNL